MEYSSAPIFRYSSRSELFSNKKEYQSHYQDNAVLVVEDAGISYDKDFFLLLRCLRNIRKLDREMV